MSDIKLNPKLDSILNMYYSRKDVQDEICKFCQNREVIPRYGEGFGKRPDYLEYPTELMQHVRKGATSFHCSEEIWQNPIEISKDMEKEQLDVIRSGWDLLIDIDSKYLDYSKVMAKLLVQALEFHGVKSYGVKFSGSKGFHIIVPGKAFPEQLDEKETRIMFPEWARIISLYLNEFVKSKLIEQISELTSNTSKSISKYIKGDKKQGDAAEKVAPDIVLVSSRHLFRCPYSLHEKTALASIVLDKSELENFQPSDAEPLKVKVKSFMPHVKEGEARELLIQALDWSRETSSKKESEKEKKNFDYDMKDIKIDRSKITMPPCIEKIMRGLKDGKKRALFILINYFRSLNFSEEEVTEKINEWNKKNKPAIKEGYVRSQISYAFKHKKIMPPNCDKYYKDFSVCSPIALCKKIKNPLNFTLISARRQTRTKDKK